MDMVAVTSMVLPSLNVRDSKVFLTEMVEEELNQITMFHSTVYIDRAASNLISFG